MALQEVRVVFPDGTAEIMPTATALRRAQELGPELVVVSPTALPPVAKAIDYGHYRYDLKKKRHEAKKKRHVVQVKELKFRPNTDDHDYDFKKNHAITGFGAVDGSPRLAGRNAHIPIGPIKVLKPGPATKPKLGGAPSIQ
jgi:translation initiation factor IF-3